MWKNRPKPSGSVYDLTIQLVEECWLAGYTRVDIYPRGSHIFASPSTATRWEAKRNRGELSPSPDLWRILSLMCLEGTGNGNMRRGDQMQPTAYDVQLISGVYLRDLHSQRQMELYFAYLIEEKLQGVRLIPHVHFCPHGGSRACRQGCFDPTWGEFP